MTENTLKSDIDGYGFQRAEDFNHTEHDRFMGAYLPIMTRRAMRWNGLLGNKETVSKSGTVKRYCRKGIPAEHRPMVWMCLSGAEMRMRTNSSLYSQLLSASHSQEMMDTINMDLHRTFPDNVYFASSGSSTSLRRPLYNVLIALAHKNKNLGYCQGMNFVAGLLLLILKSEEKVFWLMDTLFNNILPDYYSPDMLEVRIEQRVLGEIIKWKAPDLASHLEKIGLSWELIGMKWFICLFADVMPVDTVLRIWDCLFNEGSKILIRASAVLVLSNKEKLLQCRDLSECLQLFHNIASSPITLHCHTFLKSMFEDVGSLPMSKITKLRAQCKGEV